MADLEQVLEEKRKLVDEKATIYRNSRDEWNARTKTCTITRNELNAEVRELIQNVRQQREIREQMNEVVRDMKKIRADGNDKVKAAKTILDTARGEPAESKQDGRRGGKGRDRPMTVHELRRRADRLELEFEMGKHTGQNEKKVMEEIKKIRSQVRDMKLAEDGDDSLKDARSELKTAMEAQEVAHLEVQKAANAAQEAHDLMLQWNKEVDRQRDKAESSHRDLRRSKKEADKAHHYYIVSLRCLHSIQDILRARRGSGDRGGKKGARIEIQDLMSKLMSGDTLTTDQLMQLQRFD
ncbi:MAG: coiled-coil protein [Candidatus Poseidoniales archaeon]|jgi:uncharacterized coiled-coil DUF342 family protein